MTAQRCAILTTALVATVIAAPNLAAADVRYAAPGGSGPEATCPHATPCDLQDAVEGPNAVQDDEVILLPGTYSLGPVASDELTIDKPLNVHGQAGQPPPRIVSTVPLVAMEIDSVDATVSDLILDMNGPAGTYAPGAIWLYAGTVERVVVEAENTVIACRAAGDSLGEALFRDSVCWNPHGAAGAGALFGGFGRLVNVTAIGLISGVVARADGTTFAAIDARNVIAITTATGSCESGDVYAYCDVYATTIDSPAPGTGSATVTLRNSNFSSAATRGPGTSVTPVTANSNQSAEPYLADLAGGDFHQIVGSPTIDAGVNAPPIGTLDFERQARIQGSAPDIGADEGQLIATFVLDLSGRSRQEIHRLLVRAHCASPAPCDLKIRGNGIVPFRGAGSSDNASGSAKAKRFRLKKKSVVLDAGKGSNVRVRFKKNNKSVKKISKLLKRSKKARTKAKVIVTVSGTSGGATNKAKQKIKLKKK